MTHISATIRRLSTLVLALILTAPGFTHEHEVSGEGRAGWLPSRDAATADEGITGRTRELADLWTAEHVQMPLPPLVRHADVEAAIDRAVREGDGLVTDEIIGRSVEGRAIHHVTIGHGPFGVLLWSQMHGDEPSATVALFDLLSYLSRHRAEPRVARLLDRMTLQIVPMLNPDGAERFERRNAQGIDINRDALRLETPEGRALKGLRDRFEPSLGFNLHNQNWRTSVGTPPRPAAMSLLAVAYDEARSENEGRRLAKRVCAVIRDAVEPLAPGMIGRYDDSFEVRAFGDNITRWGTPVVLIETGPFPSRAPDAALVQMNFVALAQALHAVASDRAIRADPDRYEKLPMNGSSLLFTRITGARIANPGIEPFIADIGIGASRAVTAAGSARRLGWSARIEDLGDLRVYGAIEEIDGNDLVAVPLGNRAVTEGDVIEFGSDRASRDRIAVGEPAGIVLLSPVDRRRYTVVRIVRFEGVGG
jgi:hypothetical protein